MNQTKERIIREKVSLVLRIEEHLRAKLATVADQQKMTTSEIIEDLIENWLK